MLPGVSTRWSSPTRTWAWTSTTAPWPAWPTCLGGETPCSRRLGTISCSASPCRPRTSDARTGGGSRGSSEWKKGLSLVLHLVFIYVYTLNVVNGCWISRHKKSEFYVKYQWRPFFWVAFKCKRSDLHKNRSLECNNLGASYFLRKKTMSSK